MDINVNGWKTYIIATLMICFAMAMIILQRITMAEGIQFIMLALGIMGLRNAIPVK